MIKLSDYVVSFLVEKGICDIFLVSGGGIMHLLDSVGRNKRLRYFCNHHEQASAICAEAYSRAKGTMGCCLVTTGPGSTNALSGVVGAWYDSIPMLVISGQVKRELIADYQRVRQLACQEVNIMDMARPVTKYIKTITEPELIRYELETALYRAREGRPGPVWIDIPLDVQGSMIDETKLVPADLPHETGGNGRLLEDVAAVVGALKKSRRPLLMCGNGIRLGGAELLLADFLDEFAIPTVLALSATDLVPEDHPSYLGIVGHVAQRRANFALQNCDLLLSIGSGLNSAKVGFNYQDFASRATKIVVDIDACQLSHQIIRPDLPILADAAGFLKELSRALKEADFTIAKRWSSACMAWKKRYPVITPDFWDEKEYVNSYVFFDRLSSALSEGDLVVTGNGLECPSCFQAFRSKKDQRVIFNTNYGSMGWGFPASIGVAVANPDRKTVCVDGDGGFQMNLQELQTVFYYRLPIKLFVFNNRGYASIRATQNSFFAGHLVGADESSGVTNPDFEKLAQANGVPFERILNHDELGKISDILLMEGPVLCEVNISPEQQVVPKCSAYTKDDGTIASRPYEDMSPLLPREEIWANMHLFDDDEP